VCTNTIITSLLYRKHPAQLKFVMIDPKMVEFSLYGKLERHFLAKMESEEKAIITDPMKAVYTLNSLCIEMDNRLELCSQAGARNIVEYNEKFTARRLNPEKGHRYLPYIVVIVDEFADLIMMARDVERPVMRLAQKQTLVHELSAVETGCPAASMARQIMVMALCRVMGRSGWKRPLFPWTMPRSLAEATAPAWNSGM